MYHKLVILSLAILGAAVPISAETCVSLDAKIEPQILEISREILRNSSSEFIPFGEWNIGHFGLQASWERGYVGNFSTVFLDDTNGLSSAQVCTSENIRRLTMSLYIGFQHLEARFSNFELSLPFFKTEGAWARFSTPGGRGIVTIMAAQDISSKECSISLGSVEFKSWGPVELSLKGNAGRNWLTEIVFNKHRDEIVKFLSAFGVGTQVNEFTRNRLTAALENHKNVICGFMA